MNNAQFDRLFDAAFEAADRPGSDNLTVDHRPSWQRMQKRLNSRRRKRRMSSTLSKLAIVAASLVLGAFLFGNDRAVKAIEPIYATIKEYPSGLMNLIFGREEGDASSQAKTAPPPAHLEGLSYERLNDSTLAATVTEAQAGKLLSFRTPAFGYLPDSFSFENALLIFHDGKERADYAIFQFVSERGENLAVIMQRVDPNTGLGAKNTPEGVSAQSLQLSEGPAILMTASDESSTLETIRNDIRFSISGKFTHETLVRIYDGLKW
jgi:hypothetical protein